MNTIKIFKFFSIIIFFSYQTFSQTKEHKSYHKNGKLEEIGKLINGKKEGEWKNYDENGKLWLTTNYTNNKENGEKKWYTNGQLYRIEQYNNDVKNGKEISFFLNGNILKTENYFEGKLNGEGFYYDMDGKLISKGNYQNDAPIGTWDLKVYKPNGNIYTLGSYVNGKKEGEWKVFYTDNIQILSANYINGEIINGEIVSRFELNYYENLKEQFENGFNKGGVITESMVELAKDSDLIRVSSFSNKIEVKGENRIYNNKSKQLIVIAGFTSDYTAYYKKFNEGNILKYEFLIHPRDKNTKGQEVEYIEYYANGEINKMGWYTVDTKNADKVKLFYNFEGGSVPVLGEEIFDGIQKNSEWKFYDELGKLRKTENWEKDNLISTKEF